MQQLQKHLHSYGMQGCLGEGNGYWSRVLHVQPWTLHPLSLHLSCIRGLQLLPDKWLNFRSIIFFEPTLPRRFHLFLSNFFFLGPFTNKFILHTNIYLFIKLTLFALSLKVAYVYRSDQRVEKRSCICLDRRNCQV